MAHIKASKISRVRERFDLPFEDEATFVSKVRDMYHKDVQADYHNIEPARQDIQFVIGDQWDPNARERRERLGKPVLTVNRLPAFVAQFIGSWLQSDTTMKLIPARGGSKKVAEVRQGIIRTTVKSQESRRALHKAMENAYICGIGNFEVDLRDAKNDVFLRDIVVQPVDDPFAVVWDRASYEPTGSDAQHCFVTKYMTKEDFERAYPDASSDSGWYSDELDNTVMVGHGWYVDEMVRVAKFWQMREEPVKLGLEAESGDVIDLKGMTADEIALRVALDEHGDPITRETVRPYAECYVLSSTEILEGPFRLDIPRLPVFRVEGWSLQEASVRYRWGFVRNAKDPQRLHNYWRSVLAEELSQSVSSKWLLDTAGAKTGLADQFRNAHLSGDRVLFWDSQAGGAQPQLLPPPPLNQAVLTEAGMTVQDIKDVTNKSEASLGQKSNEVSGKAITARQRISELGDVIYVENMNAALAEAGRVINELIPVVYDTNRTVKLTGDDDTESLQEINGRFGDQTPDVTLGKYDITYTTGPSYATKRQEGVDIMLTLMNTMPQVGNVIADIIVRNMDIPGAEEIEERLASLLPAGTVDIERLPPRRREAAQQKAQQAAQAAQQAQQVQLAMVKLQMAKLNAEAGEITARANRQIAQARVAASEIGMTAASVDVDELKAAIDAMKLGLSIDQTNIDLFQRGLAAAAQVGAQAPAQAGTTGPGQPPEQAAPEAQAASAGGGDSGPPVQGQDPDQSSAQTSDTPPPPGA